MELNTVDMCGFEENVLTLWGESEEFKMLGRPEFFQADTED